jgi:hypothetical protein
VVAEAAQKPRDARPADELVGQRQVERRQVMRLILREVGRRAALAEADPGPEHRVVAEPQPQLEGARRLPLHQQPLDPRLRPDGAGCAPASPPPPPAPPRRWLGATTPARASLLC